MYSDGQLVVHVLKNYTDNEQFWENDIQRQQGGLNTESVDTTYFN